MAILTLLEIVLTALFQTPLQTKPILLLTILIHHGLLIIVEELELEPSRLLTEFFKHENQHQ